MAAKIRGLWHTFVHAVLGIEAAHAVWVWYSGGALVSLVGVVTGYVKGNPAVLYVSLGFLAAFILMLITNGLVRWRTARMHRDYLPLRRRLELSRYTSAGLSWEVVDYQVVQDRAEATLRIRPTGTVELPQPLVFHITCAGIAEPILNTVHYPSETRDFDIWPVGDPRFFIMLRSPRLYPPGYVDIRLRSKGTSIRVMSVKRNPK
jgi:hypothetical protein